MDIRPFGVEIQLVFLGCLGFPTIQNQETKRGGIFCLNLKVLEKSKHIWQEFYSRGPF